MECEWADLGGHQAAADHTLLAGVKLYGEWERMVGSRKQVLSLK